MFNPICLFVDAFLTIALAWNAVMDFAGQGALMVDANTIERLFGSFYFFCGVRDA